MLQCGWASISCRRSQEGMPTPCCAPRSSLLVLGPGRTCCSPPLCTLRSGHTSQLCSWLLCGSVRHESRHEPLAVGRSGRCILGRTTPSAGKVRGLVRACADLVGHAGCFVRWAFVRHSGWHPLAAPRRAHRHARPAAPCLVLVLAAPVMGRGPIGRCLGHCPCHWGWIAEAGPGSRAASGQRGPLSPNSVLRVPCESTDRRNSCLSLSFLSGNGSGCRPAWAGRKIKSAAKRPCLLAGMV
mmetsp:Transcript_52496/g.170498  ORF Transcript_52496/g.170498 Transcript_52496/m.170498 type:complete len:241 (+) Transcript_52496:287-1009(+)